MPPRGGSLRDRDKTISMRAAARYQNIYKCIVLHRPRQAGKLSHPGTIGRGAAVAVCSRIKAHWPPPSDAQRYALEPMTPFHAATFRLLGIEPRISRTAVSECERAERRFGFRLPSSVREWYSYEDALDLLTRYSNQDWPIPVRKFATTEWNEYRLLPFKNENQGVCVWAILLDGSDDPPVYVDVDSNGAQWSVQAPTFTAHVYACVWDYLLVLDQAGLVQAQNEPLSTEAINELRRCFSEQARTFGWPGNTQHRFTGEDQAILIWSGEYQADWFVGARDEPSMESALRAIWNLDGVGQSLYDCSGLGKAVLERIDGGA